MEDTQKPNPIVTTDYVRKILGEKGIRMTDKEIEAVINTLTVTCDKTIDHVVNTNKI